MAAIALNTITPLGVTATPAAASGGGDTIAVGAGGHILLVVHNGDASAKTVTVVRAGNDEFALAIPDITKSVPAGADGVFEIKQEFRDTSDGLVDITYSAVTSVTVTAWRIG